MKSKGTFQPMPPIVDCCDEMLCVQKISLSPNTELVNTMLDEAIKKLGTVESPIVHADRGVHYHQSACKGVFGLLKNEMF